jgi:hypothetical protein
LRVAELEAKLKGRKSSDNDNDNGNGNNNDGDDDRNVNGQPAVSLSERTDAVPPKKLTDNNELDIKAQYIPGIFCDVRFVSMKLQDNGDHKKIPQEFPFEGPNAQENNSKDTPPLLVETYYSKDGKKEKALIKISSKGLQGLMENTIKAMLSHESGSVWKDRVVVLSSRNVPVLHCFDELQKVAEGEKTPPGTRPTDTDRKELKSFLLIVQQVEKELFEGWESIKKAKEVDYVNIWMLFPPGSEVVAFPFSNLPQIFLVHRHVFDEKSLIITCWAYDWNGTELTRNLYEFHILSFKDRKSVFDLPCYPLKYYADSANGTPIAELRRKLIERGKKFKDLCVRPEKDGRMFQCDGEILYDSPRDTSKHTGLISLLFDPLWRTTDIPLKYEGKSKVMVDAALYNRYGMGMSRFGSLTPTSGRPCDCSLCSQSGHRKKWQTEFNTTQSDAEQYNELFSLLPPRVLGFVMERKVWGQVPVLQTNAVDYRDHIDKWDRLVLAENHKKMLKKLLESHYMRAQTTQHEAGIIKDVVPGKGEGLVFLLHGKRVSRNLRNRELTRLRRTWRWENDDCRNSCKISSTSSTTNRRVRLQL